MDAVSVAFDSLVVGEDLLDIRKEPMGNTTLRAWCCWKVRVISIDKTERTAMCSWNGNRARIYFERDFKSLRRKPSKAFLDQEERRRKTGSWL